MSWFDLRNSVAVQNRWKMWTYTLRKVSKWGSMHIGEFKTMTSVFPPNLSQAETGFKVTWDLTKKYYFEGMC